MRRKQWLLFMLILLGPSRGLYAQQWSGVLSASRAIDWSKAGVPGGIPNRTTACTTLNPGASDAQINAAIAACPSGQVVFLNAGTYSLSSGLIFNAKNNVTLRGAGSNLTFLVFSGGGNGCGGVAGNVCMINADPDYRSAPSNVANWTAGYSRGTTQITLSNTANLQIGTNIILDQVQDSSDDGTIYTQQIIGSSGALGTCIQCDNPGRNNRPQEQIVTVTAINGSTITITPGL